MATTASGAARMTRLWSTHRQHWQRDRTRARVPDAVAVPERSYTENAEPAGDERHHAETPRHEVAARRGVRKQGNGPQDHELEVGAQEVEVGEPDVKAGDAGEDQEQHRGDPLVVAKGRARS